MRGHLIKKKLLKIQHELFFHKSNKPKNFVVCVIVGLYIAFKKNISHQNPTVGLLQLHRTLRVGMNLCLTHSG